MNGPLMLLVAVVALVILAKSGTSATQYKVGDRIQDTSGNWYVVMSIQDGFYMIMAESDGLLYWIPIQTLGA